MTHDSKTLTNANPAATGYQPRHRPVFIVGAVRSGTTMLRLMLREHPLIAGGGEFEYALLGTDNSQLPDAATYRRLLAEDRAFQATGLDVDSSLDTLEQIHSFMRQRCDPDSQQRLLSVVHNRFDQLPMLHDDALYIHMLRDPRDVARSCMVMGWSGNLYHAAPIWMKAQQRWDDLVATLPDDRHITVRYESLLEDVEGTLAEVCRFIGVEFEPTMLDYDSKTSYSKPDPTLAWQWKRKLSPGQIQQVEVRCRDMMIKRGYEPSGPASDFGWFRRMQLDIGHRIGRMSQSAKRYGLPLYLHYQLARRGGDWLGRQHVIKRMNEIDRQNLK